MSRGLVAVLATAAVNMGHWEFSVRSIIYLLRIGREVLETRDGER